MADFTVGCPDCGYIFNYLSRLLAHYSEMDGEFLCVNATNPRDVRNALVAEGRDPGEWNAPRKLLRQARRRLKPLSRETMIDTVMNAKPKVFAKGAIGLADLQAKISRESVMVVDEKNFKLIYKDMDGEVHAGDGATIARLFFPVVSPLLVEAFRPHFGDEFADN